MSTAPADAPGLPSAPTVADLIRHGAAAFERAGLAFGHGMDDATDEAAALVFHALQLDHSNAAAAYLQRPTAAECDRVLALFRERIERRVPAAYLMGRMWFAGREFVVDPRVIVPRSPFAELLLAHFDHMRVGVNRHIHFPFPIGSGNNPAALGALKIFADLHSSSS